MIAKIRNGIIIHLFLRLFLQENLIYMIYFISSRLQNDSKKDPKETKEIDHLAFFILLNIPCIRFYKDMYRGCNKKVYKGYTQVTYPI